MVLNRTRDIRALYEITTILNTPLSFAQAIIQVLNRTVELMNTQASTIHSCDEKNKQIKLMCQVGLSTKLEEELRDNSLFQAIIQEVILQDGPLFLENLTDKLSPIRNLLRWINCELSWNSDPGSWKAFGCAECLRITKSVSLSMNKTYLLPSPITLA